jgi:hypothetical protein
MIGTWTPWAGLVLFVMVPRKGRASIPPRRRCSGRALAAGGRLSFGVILATAVAAALSADLVWYGLGRWRGAQALAVLRRRVKPRAWMDRVESLFLAHRFGTLFGARFLPEMNPVGAGLAGASGVGPAYFLLSGSALVPVLGRAPATCAATAILHMSR